MIKFLSKNPNDILEQLQKEICCLDEQIQQIVIGGLGWALTGNELTTPTSFIGSTNLADFVVKTNNAERMRVLASGLVGVNTSAPTAPLDINGQIRVRGGSPGAGKVLTSDANGLASWSTIVIPPSGVTGAESGLHLEGTVARLGGPILETVAIIGDAPTKKVIFQGVVDLNNGDYTDAYVIYDVTGECPAIGIHSENSGIYIEAAGNGIDINGGIFGVNVIGDTTGIVSVGNTQNGGDFSGLRGGLNVAYGRQTDQGQAMDFGVKVVAQGQGSKGTPILVQVPTFTGTIQNMIDLQQTTTGSIINGYGESVRFSYGTATDGNFAVPINEIRSVWVNVQTNVQAFQLWSTTPGNIGDIQKTFTVYNNGQLQFDRYLAATPFTGGTRMLTVDTNNGLVYTQPLPTNTGLTDAQSGVRNDGGIVKLGGQLLETASIPIMDATVNISINGINAAANSPTLSVSTTGLGGTAIRGTVTNGTGYGVMGVAANVFNSAGVYAESNGPAAALIAKNLAANGNAIFAQSNATTAYFNTKSASQTTAVYAESTLANGFTLGTGTAIDGRSGTGTGVAGTSQTSGIGVLGASGSGLAFSGVAGLKVFSFEMNNITAPSTGVHVIGSFGKSTGGFVNTAAGFGLALDYQLATSTALMKSAGTQVYRWVDSTDAARSSGFDLTLFQAGTAVTPMTINGSKGVTFTGTTNFVDNPFGFFNVINSGTHSAVNIRNTGIGGGLTVTASGSAALLVSGNLNQSGGTALFTYGGNDNPDIDAPVQAKRTTVTNNTVTPNIEIISRGPAAGTLAGFGGAIRFTAQFAASLNEGRQAMLYTKWIDATDGSSDASFTIQTARAGALEDKMVIDNLGQVTLNKYASAGPPSFPGSPAFMLGTDATGKIIQVPPVGATASPVLFSGTGDPNTVVTPTQPGDLYVDTTAMKLYFSGGLTSSDWKLITSA